MKPTTATRVTRVQGKSKKISPRSMRTARPASQNHLVFGFNVLDDLDDGRGYYRELEEC